MIVELFNGTNNYRSMDTNNNQVIDTIQSDEQLLIIGVNITSNDNPVDMDVGDIDN